MRYEVEASSNRVEPKPNFPPIEVYRFNGLFESGAETIYGVIGWKNPQPNDSAPMKVIVVVKPFQLR